MKERELGTFSYETYLLVNKALGLATRSREEREQLPLPPTSEEFEAAKRLHGDAGGAAGENKP